MVLTGDRAGNPQIFQQQQPNSPRLPEQSTGQAGRWKRLQFPTASLTSSTMTQLKGSSPCREKADSSRLPPLVLSVQQMMSDSRMMSACTFWECPRTFKHNRTPWLKFSLNCNSECSCLGFYPNMQPEYTQISQLPVHNSLRLWPWSIYPLLYKYSQLHQNQISPQLKDIKYKNTSAEVY